MDPKPEIVPRKYQLGYDYWSLPRHRTNCVNLVECRLCWKCRNYRSDWVKCQRCDIPLCNTKLHTEEVLARMIVRPRIELGE